jgi:hypothetical protein
MGKIEREPRRRTVNEAGARIGRPALLERSVAVVELLMGSSRIEPLRM